MSIHRYVLQPRRARSRDDIGKRLLTRCSFVETDEEVPVELDDRVLVRFRTLAELLAAFALGRDDLREIVP